MPKRVDIDTATAAQKIRELIALVQQLNQVLAQSGQAFSGGMSGLTTAAAPTTSAMTGSVGMSGGTATLSVPLNASPGPPSTSILGAGGSLGRMADSGRMMPTVLGDTGYGGPAAAANAPGNFDPGQPRDARGRFAARGGPGAGDDAADGDGGGSPLFGKYVGFRTLRELARGVADVANDSTNYTITGQANPLSVGTAAGQLGGGAIGLSLMAAGAGVTLAGGAGLIAAPLIGAGVNAAQAPAIQRQAIATSLAAYAGATGQDANALASGAAQIASQQNTAFFEQDFARQTSSGNPLQNIWGRFVANNQDLMRRWGWHVGTDQISAQDVSRIEDALGNAALSQGRVLTSDQLRAESAKYVSRGGPIGTAQAESAARAMAAMPSVNDNMFDLAAKVGIAPVAQYLRDQGRGGEVAGLADNLASAQRVGVTVGIAESRVGGLQADLAASYYSGRSPAQRSGEYAAVRAGLQTEISAVERQIGVLRAGGSAEALASAEGKMRELTGRLVETRGQEATALVGNSSMLGAIGVSAAGIGTTAAELYGTSSEIRTAGGAMMGALNAQQAQLMSMLNTPNLPSDVALQMREQINQIGAQKVQRRAQTAGAGMRRTFLDQDINVAIFAADMTQADLYGTDAQLGATAFAGVSASDFIANDALRAAGDPNLSAADRAAAQMRSAAARQQSLRLRSGSRDALLGRIGGRAGIAESDATNALNQATMYGRDGDIANSGAGLISALGDERQKLLDQIKAGGLTAEQDIRVRGRISQIEGQQLQIGGGVRDTEIGRMESRSGIANQAAANVLGRAAYGTGDDVRKGAAGLIGSLGDEGRRIQDEISKGGLTFDQEQRLRSRLLDISNRQFEIRESAIDTGYAKDDMSGFGIRSIELSARRQISELMPFGTGDRLSANVLTIRNDQSQLGVLQQRERALRQSGDLSPERLYQIRQQEAGLAVEIAQGAANLSDGLENQLPALSAGGPSSFRKFDSMQLASLAYYRVGSPIRGSGAINGRQAQMQRDAFNDLSGGFVPERVPSMTQGINNGHVEGLLGQIVTLLQANLQGGGGRVGSMMRTSEMAGQALGQLAERHVGQGYNGRAY